MRNIICALCLVALLASCGKKPQLPQPTTNKDIDTTAMVDTSAIDTLGTYTEMKVEEEKETVEESPREEVRPRSLSWKDVVASLGKSYKVIGIYTMWQGGTELNVIVYRKGGRYYISNCKKELSPFNHEYAESLVKKSSTTYVHNEPGSDMPEKFVIADGALRSYCYNPDMYEWVAMGEYWKVY